ncbi:MAG: RdgB/HAM1 family non-canonical purine NTP pyrophosphatase [Alphaproteobacteria bacterium]|nr:RdgB/HAM1 family non-canonical purine NTP pyrophosphatase [Alphaproteobacteria bacterium]
MGGQRLNAGGRLVVATHNKGKLAEMADLLRPYGLDCVSAGSLGVEEPDETGTTFEANAALKARHTATATRLPALADDSGICVSALDGDPGVFTANWAGPKRDFARAMRMVEAALDGAKDRTAKFVSVLALAWPDGEVSLFRGEVEGTLVWPPRGTRGFGYDPMFVPAGHAITFGEMEPEKKHTMSHRAVAFAKFKAACLDPIR